MHKLLITLGAIAAWFLLGHFGLLAVLAYVWATAMTTTNTAKTRAVEDRVNAMVPTLAQLNQGTFTNVSGGSTIQLTTAQGSVSLHCGALSNFTSGPQTTFLATLSQGQSPGGVADDPNSGSTWVANERAQYINDLRDKWNSLLGSLISNGFIKSA